MINKANFALLDWFNHLFNPRFTDLNHEIKHTAIAEVNGRKQLTGRTELAVEISNECGRLIALAIIYYNSMLLNLLLKRYQEEGNTKGIALLSKISPVAWQHIYLLGHYLFKNQHDIDLYEIISALKLD